MGKKAKVIGAAAGVAAAATAAVVVTRKGAAKKITAKVAETMKAARKKAADAKKKAMEAKKTAPPKKSVAAPKALVYHVMKSGDQWAVQVDGAARATSLHPNKREALSAGRALAASKAPSELVIHRADGSVQTSHTYEPE